MKVTFELISEPQIDRELFRHFDRYQEVKRCWRKETDGWKLKEVPFVEQWGESEYEFLVKCLKNTADTGGFVIGCLEDGKLKGFASVEHERFGSGKQYVQLSCIHVSCESRGKGYGKKLFQYAALAGKRLGAAKLYISAHSSEETQAFYHAMGCVEAEEYNQKLYQAEPCDCQLEYGL
ncbi:GNAT family N-acetyltransferase [Lachnospiraceae bacterium KK002]